MFSTEAAPLRLKRLLSHNEVKPFLQQRNEVQTTQMPSVVFHFSIQLLIQIRQNKRHRILKRLTEEFVPSVCDHMELAVRNDFFYIL